MSPRHRWTPEEASALRKACTGHPHYRAAEADVERALGWLPTRNQADAAMRQYEGTLISQLFGNVAAPRPAPNAVASNTPEPDVEWKGARSVTAIGFERRLVIADLHIPFHLTSALSAVYALAAAIQPHHVIVLGDLINNGGFSRHDPYSPEPERYDLTIQAARGVLRAFKRASPGSKIHVVLGNHDCWSDRWIASNPWAQGATFDLELQLGIRAPADDDREPPNADVALYKRPEEEPLVLGPIGYSHGNGGGMHFAKRYDETLCPRTGIKTLRVGHHHQLAYFRARNGHECWGVPWLGDERLPAFHYAPPPRSWYVGALVDDVCGDRWVTTPVPIVNGQAFFGGRLIGGERAVAA